MALNIYSVVVQMIGPLPLGYEFIYYLGTILVFVLVLTLLASIISLPLSGLNNVNIFRYPIFNRFIIYQTWLLSTFPSFILNDNTIFISYLLFNAFFYFLLFIGILFVKYIATIIKNIIN